MLRLIVPSTSAYDEGMLSIERVKELIGDPKLSDEEATIIRDEMHELVTIIYEKWCEERRLAKLKNEPLDNP